MPYAREHDLVVVTSDVKYFGSLPADAHAGVVILYDDTMPAYRVASALLAMVDAYPSRDEFGINANDHLPDQYLWYGHHRYFIGWTDLGDDE